MSQCTDPIAAHLLRRATTEIDPNDLEDIEARVKAVAALLDETLSLFKLYGFKVERFPADSDSRNLRDSWAIWKRSSRSEILAIKHDEHGSIYAFWLRPGQAVECKLRHRSRPAQIRDNCNMQTRLSQP